MPKAAFFKMAPSWKEPRRLSEGECVKQMGTIRTIDVLNSKTEQAIDPHIILDEPPEIWAERDSQLGRRRAHDSIYITFSKWPKCSKHLLSGSVEATLKVYDSTTLRISRDTKKKMFLRGQGRKSHSYTF